MKKTLAIASVFALFLVPALTAHATSVGDAKQAWQNTFEERLSADKIYKQATTEYQKNKTPENDKTVIDAAKEALTAVLNEAEAWLNWKNAEAQANPYASDEIKQNIDADVNKNLDKIAGLKQEVDAIDTRIEVATVFLKMAGSYVELLADVARNTGAVWVETGKKLITAAESLEIKLRETAENMDDNAAALSALDKAETELAGSKDHAAEASSAYKLVVLPGTPLIKFAEGNKHLRLARLNLLTAQEYLAEAWRLIAKNNQ